MLNISKALTVESPLFTVKLPIVAVEELSIPLDVVYVPVAQKYFIS